MRMRSIVKTPLACLALVGLLGFAVPALADTTCTGALANTTIIDNVIVPAGASCTLTSVIVRGNVQVQPGAAALTVNGAYILGNVQSQGAAVTLTNNGALIEPDLTMVGGAVQVTGGSLWIGYATIGGDVQANNANFVVIGLTSINGNVNIQNLAGFSPSFGTNFLCASTVRQNFQFQQSTVGATFLLGASGALGCFGNTILGNVQIQNNAGAVTVTNNVVIGDLQCGGNNVNTPPVGGANRVAGQESGQCSGL
jgi:hypothetical protein